MNLVNKLEDLVSEAVEAELTDNQKESAIFYANQIISAVQGGYENA